MGMGQTQETFSAKRQCSDFMLKTLKETENSLLLVILELKHFKVTSLKTNDGTKTKKKALKDIQPLLLIFHTAKANNLALLPSVL